jgi:hypothetical protein
MSKMLLTWFRFVFSKTRKNILEPSQLLLTCFFEKRKVHNQIGSKLLDPFEIYTILAIQAYNLIVIVMVMSHIMQQPMTVGLVHNTTHDYKVQT